MSTTQNMQIAATILNQISMGAKMTVGYHNPFSIEKGVMFGARILPMNKNGKRAARPRNMFVCVTLNSNDLYDIVVRYDKKIERVTHFSADNLYGDMLDSVLLALDFDGETITNPRYWN